MTYIRSWVEYRKTNRFYHLKLFALFLVTLPYFTILTKHPLLTVMYKHYVK